VALLFPAWLIGVLAYRLCAARRLGRAAGWALLLAPLAAVVAWHLLSGSVPQQFSPVTLERERVESMARDYLIAAAFALHVVGFAAVSASFAPWLERHAPAIRWVAGATFSVYLAHLPIMHMLAATSPLTRSSPANLVLLLFGTVAACLLFAEMSERRKEGWRRGITVVMRRAEALMPAAKAGS
jgi:peptidoglycan/LPS O-acetylase OafA/YrhL